MRVIPCVCFMPASLPNFLLCLPVALAVITVSCREREKPATAPSRTPQLGTMEFEVLERSDHPGHKTSPYADCLYTARLRVIDPKVTAEPKIVMGAIPAFLGRKLQTGAAMRPGDRIRASWLPFDKAPENFRRMQTADRFGDYLLDYLLLTDVQITATRQVSEVSPPAVAARVTPVIPQERFIRPQGAGPLAERRQARVQDEINRIKSLLHANGGTWDAWMKQLKPTHDKLGEMGRASDFAMKKDQHFFNRVSLRAYTEICEDDPHTGPVGALRLLNAELHRRGIDLLVVPFPTKEDVNVHKFVEFPKDAEINPQRLRFHLHLLENNIEVLDLTPALKAALEEHEFVFFDNRDVHPADGGIQVAAREIAKVLHDYGLGVEPAQQPPVKAEWMVINREVPGFTLGAKYPATRVIFPTKSPVPEEVQRRVIFQGDSFLHVPGYFLEHATIADHAGRHLGFEPETVLREAGANLILPDLARTPKEKLQGRLVLVFVFGPTRLRSPRSGLARLDYEWHLALLPE